MCLEGREVFSYTSGYADVENKIPMTLDHYVNIYSCSKVATVAAALQLYEQGKFLLDDPLYAFIPEYKEMYIASENGPIKTEKPITLRQLFTMTSGLTYNRDTQAFEKARELTGGKMDTLTVARCSASDPLAFEPGARWNYSLSHDVLAAVVEVISGKHFSEYVRENIFDSLDKTVGSTGNLGEFGWGGAAGATVLVDPDLKLSVFYAHHMLNPQEHYYQPRLRNIVYSCIL